MVESKQRQEKISQTTKSLEAVLAVDPASLARREESTKLNFAESAPFLQRTQDVFRALSSRDISPLPGESLDHINHACQTFLGLVQKIRAFDIGAGNARDTCHAINAEVTNSYDGIVKLLLLPLAFTATQQANYGQIEREAKGFHAELKNQFEATQVFIKAAKDDAEKALAAVREQAAEAGVATNAQIFDREARDRAKSADTWLRWTVTLTIATSIVAIAALVVVFFWTPGDAPQAIQYVASKLILLSVLTFATVWCGRNYRSHKHNETLNLHRAHALMTFRAFVEGTKDPRISDAVLVQAAHAAFQGRPTGYEVMSDSTSQATPLVDTVARAAAKAASTS